MRPTAQPQSALRHPLNNILATEANVRVLRVLSGVTSAISAPELAKRAQLQRSSVHRTVRTLEETGILEYVGIAPHNQIALRDRSSLAKLVRLLFQSEQSRYDDLLAAIKKAAETINPPPIAVWIEGPVAEGKDRLGDPIILTVVESSRTLGKSADMMGELTVRIAQRFDVHIEIRSRTRADLDALTGEESEALLNAISLLGLPPGGLLKEYRDLWVARNIKSHSSHDKRALEYGHALAHAIAKDPTLLDEAKRFLARRWREASPAERKELTEWKQLLNAAPPATLRKALTDPGERGTRLRQTIPFIGIFDAERPVRP
jgi:DNA-binding Lrp family transcriptional regulator